MRFVPVGDVVGADCRWDLILCGDVCYEAPMTGAHPALAARDGAATAEVWIADPGRAYLPRDGCQPRAPSHRADHLELEDRTSRDVDLIA